MKIKNIVKFLLIVNLVLLPFVFMMDFVYAAEGVSEDDLQISKNQALNQNDEMQGDVLSVQDRDLEYRELVDKIITYNLHYLAICVTILLTTGAVSGVVVYFLSIRPTYKEIEKSGTEIEQSKKEILALRKELERSMEKLKQDMENVKDHLKQKIDDKTKSLEEQIVKKQKIFEEMVSLAVQKLRKEIKDEARRMKLDMRWTEFFLWSGQKVYVNVLGSLIEILSYADISNPKFCLQMIIETLDKMVEKRTLFGKEDKVYKNLIRALNEVKGFEEMKDEILKRLRKI